LSIKLKLLQLLKRSRRKKFITALNNECGFFILKMKQKLKIMYLGPTINLFKYYKTLADKSIAQVPEEFIHQQINSSSNSIAILVKHMAGNMISRFTDFQTSDGEKTWRNRETEFENSLKTKAEMSAYWEKGWSTLLDAISPLEETDLSKIVYIRNEGHTILEAMQRQLGHYAYHVGQIVYLAKHFQNKDWEYLSIRPGESESFFKEKMEKGRRRFRGL